MLILDEPTSGLDADLEREVLRLLKTISRCGCTVIVVTHAERHLKEFDLVARIVEKKHVEVSGALGRESTSIRRTGEFDPKSESSIAIKSPDGAGSIGSHQTKDVPRINRVWQSTLRKTITQFRRECSLVAADYRWKALLPLLVVPVFFAVSVLVASPKTSHELFGFLCIISAIWMGASLSTMSVVEERRITEHERLVFLRCAWYMFAKTALHWVLSTIQTSVFFWTLFVCRASFSGAEFPFSLIDCYVILILIGWASVGVGLLISVIARRSIALANFLLPMVMIGQLLFSYQVSGRKGIEDLVEVYGEFSGHSCQAHDSCSRLAQYWVASSGEVQWVCQRCGNKIVSTHETDAAALGHANRKSVPRNSFALDPNLVDDRNENEERPNRLAAWASYFTITRYGDILLRRSQHRLGEDTHLNRDDLGRLWASSAWHTLWLVAIGLPLLSAAVLSGFRIQCD